MVPEIHKLAITPDTETLVCILRDKEEERGPGSVFHAPISTLAELANNSGSPPSSVYQPWKLTPIEWPAADVTHLCVPDDDTVYMAIQPEFTIRSQEHRVPVISLSLQTGDVAILNVEAKVR